MRLIFNLGVNMLAVAVTAALLAGVELHGLLAVLLVTIALGIINTIIRPIVSILTLPLNILTLGLIGFVINGAFVLVVARLVPGFVVASFWWALLFSITLSLVGWFLSILKRS